MIIVLSVGNHCGAVLSTWCFQDDKTHYLFNRRKCATQLAARVSKGPHLIGPRSCRNEKVEMTLVEKEMLLESANR